MISHFDNNKARAELLISRCNCERPPPGTQQFIVMYVMYPLPHKGDFVQSSDSQSCLKVRER